MSIGDSEECPAVGAGPIGTPEVNLLRGMVLVLGTRIRSQSDLDDLRRRCENRALDMHGLLSIGPVR